MGSESLKEANGMKTLRNRGLFLSNPREDYARPSRAARGGASLALAALVIGGLLTFGSSSDLSVIKLVYASVVGIVTLVAFIRVIVNPGASLREIGGGIGLLAVLLSMSFLIGALLQPVGVIDVLRQGLWYFLVPAAPFIGIDLGRRLRGANVLAFTLAVGSVSAVGVGVTWIFNRGVGALDVGRLVLGSPMLAAIGFALGVIVAVHGRGAWRVVGITCVLVIPVALLITGTRTNLIFILSVIGLIGGGKKFLISLKGTVLVLFVLAVSFWLLIQAAPIFLKDSGFLSMRWRALLYFVSGNQANDQSFSERVSQYAYAYEAFIRSPWFGRSLGWVPDTSLDTPVAILARIGIVGTVLLLLFLWQCVRYVRNFERRGITSPFTAAARGVGLFILALAPFGPPFEDRGFALTMVLLFAGMEAYRLPIGFAEEGVYAPAEHGGSAGKETGDALRRGSSGVKSGTVAISSPPIGLAEKSLTGLSLRRRRSRWGVSDEWPGFASSWEVRMSATRRRLERGDGAR